MMSIKNAVRSGTVGSKKMTRTRYYPDWPRPKIISFVKKGEFPPGGGLAAITAGLAAGLMKAVIRSEITPDRAARMAYQTIDPIHPEKLKLIVPIAAGSRSVTHTPAATSIMLRHRFSGVMHPTSVRPTSVLTALATPTAIRLSAIQKTIPETLTTTPIKMIARVMNFQFTATIFPLICSVVCHTQ